MILVGCGVLLINADDKLTGYSLLDFYAYVHGLYVGIPRLAVLLLLLLSCGIYVKERDDAARSESDLVAQLIQDGLGTIQAQVVAMTISGVPIATIADKLHITASTVRSYQSRARKLLGISNLSQYAKNDRLMGNCSEKTTDNGTKNHQSKTRGDK